MEFVLVSDMHEVLAAALEATPSAEMAPVPLAPVAPANEHAA